MMTDAVDKARLEIMDGKIGMLECENYKYEQALQRIVEFCNGIINEDGENISTHVLTYNLLMRIVVNIALSALEK